MLHLVQHGQANPEDIDRERKLTEKGKDDVLRVAAYSAGLRLSPKHIYHSGKARAAQTASILADEFATGLAPESADGLSPMDDPHIWAHRLLSIEEDTMLVGHLPHLAYLAALLMCGDTEKNVINFHMGGIVCMSRTGSGWAVEWIVTPVMVP